MKCLLYARVSTDKQAEKALSLPAQLQAMRDYARQRDWTVIQEFIEPGASARTADRPLLKELLARCKEGEPKADVVLVHKIDRFARNVYDYATIRAYLKQHGVRLVSVVENTADTVSGELVENIMASIAQFYSANLGEEARKGMRQKVLNGGWPHKAPRGYVTIPNVNKPGSHVVLDRRDSVILRNAFELYATGHYSVKTLVQRLAKDGLTARSGRPVAASYLRRMLANPFYAGRILWGGLNVAGNHPPLISIELFDQMQAVIAERHRNPGPKAGLSGFPLRGLAICALCRSRMSTDRRERWSYYRCGRNSYRAASCPASFCSTKKAHGDLERLCQQIRLTAEITDGITTSAERIIELRVNQATGRKRELEHELSDLLSQEMELTEAFAAGDLSPNAHGTQASGLRDRRATIAKELTRLPLDRDRLQARVAHTIKVATSLWDYYDLLAEPQRAELVAEVFGVIVLSRVGIAGFTLRPPFDKLASAAKNDPSKLPSDHPWALAEAILDAA